MSVITPRPPTAQRPREAAARRMGFQQRMGRWDVKVSPYLYISPFFILFAVVGAFPLLYTAFVSVHEWNLLGGQGEFVGLTNYRDVFAQPTFLKAIGNTFSIFALSSVPQMIAALTLAAVLNANLRAKTFWRMGVLLPFIVAPVAVGLIFGRLFADDSGLVNALLTQVGLEPLGWHSDRLTSHIAIATMVNFRWTGYNTLIFLAAMQAVPQELYEAAIIDGAGRLRQFFSVTVPQLRPTIIFVIITATIGGLQIFDEPRLFDDQGLGGPSRNWMTVAMYMYDVGWGNQKNFGRAAAIAWLLFLIIIVVAVVNFLVSRRIATGDAPRGAARLLARGSGDAGRTPGADATRPTTASKET
ncbi:carbohydrate ABC transporter permease [Occultella aeris]|uniref:Lactose transport system permease protein LacF n=1 Tax=Occultella aeris TaxID=2761496 RepID=A0A7M4DM22_9MICO|nr:sugar ABC transporter permease [Occultella aeris]VZO38354.1 Lactose transport system permease protein LacF [Occultella aeris]